MPAVPAGNVGDYIVGRRIGAGAMAVVDAAYQQGPVGGRLVALKRVAAAFSHDPSARRLFLREGSILTRLEHPNVVRTYEVGEANGEAFIAMELLEGATVSQLQRATEERIPLAIALRVVRDALRGLHAAHELRALGGQALGLVHQDISPQNIHVAYEGTTRVLDFGVARLATVDASRTDSIRGKPCYLAPEQLNLGSIDRRADLFAMGIVLHELLTGACLFPRTRADAAYAAILFGTILPPRATHPDVAQEIDAVVARVLARDPADRFDTAEDMRRALAEAQERAGIAEIDLASLGAWVLRTAPPAWTRGEIELEVTSGATRIHLPEAPEDVATLPPRGVNARRFDTEDDPPSAATIFSSKALRRSRSRVTSAAAGTLIALVVAGLGYTLRSPRSVAAPQHAISMAEPSPALPARTALTAEEAPRIAAPSPPTASLSLPLATAPSPAIAPLPRSRRHTAVAPSPVSSQPAPAPTAEAPEPAETQPKRQNLYDQW